MKNNILYFMLTVLFCSCDVKPTEEPEADVISFRLHAVIVDEDFCDRLNPVSPAYFGEEFIREMDVLYLCDGEKLTHLQTYYFGGGGVLWHRDNIENFTPKTSPLEAPVIISPANWSCHWIDCTSEWGYFFEEGKQVSYVYIHYGDGSEDEIKVQLYENESGSILVHDKIWVNGELAYSRQGKLKETQYGTIKQDYFNPTYFPFMNGDEVDEKPNFGITFTVVITK